MLIYLLKASCCLGLLLIFYKLFLENQKMHRIKRAALLFFLVVSSIIPAITLTYYIDASPYQLNTTEIIWDGYLVIEEGINVLPLVSWTVYWIGFLIFGVKFFRNIRCLLSQIHQNEKVKIGDYTLVLQEGANIPHSFFNYVFVDKFKYENKEIPEYVLDHELSHAQQKHSLDILFIEFAQWLFWFNPLIYLLKKDIRLNHEFLADEAVLQKGYSVEEYQKTLLSYSQQSFNPLTHTLHFQPLKKRFLIMKKQSSTRSCLMRLAALIPLMAFLTFAFSSKALAQSPNSQKDEKQASEAVVKEYNKIAKEYSKAMDGIKVISSSDIQRLKMLYKQMSEDQRLNAEPFPELPPPPPAPISVESERQSIPPPPPPLSIEDIDISEFRFFIDDEEISYEEFKNRKSHHGPIRIKVLSPEGEKTELRVYSEEYWEKHKLSKVK